MAFHYSFPAVEGLQAQHEYYIAMVPMGLLSKLFCDSEEYLLPEYRAQRSINELRIPEIKDYILKNPTTYVFSALCASIDGAFRFVKSNLDEHLGILQVDMNAIILINDGQHRRAAIEGAIKENPSLSFETIAIVFFKDEGLKRSQQMFADLNKHAVKSSKSLSTLYDDRDALSNAVKHVVTSIPFLDKYIDKEHDSLGKYSSKLFTLSNFLRANQRIFKKNTTITNYDTNFLVGYWRAIFGNIEEWALMDSKQLYKRSLKEDYILTLSVFINALRRLGSCIYNDGISFEILSGLNSIDWLRSNQNWKGRIFNEQGKIIGKEDCIIKICNFLKISLGIALSKEEMAKENEIGK